MLPDWLRTLRLHLELEIKTFPTSDLSLECYSTLMKVGLPLQEREDKKSNSKLRVSELSRDECECPKGGIENGTFFCTCEFFECLDPGDYLKPIFGFVNINPKGDQCLAFVIDTTGSMYK